ncbi:MAG: DoxX family protein [Steroidobacteraceae bacterium]|nr:DoxX family protein [Steroidobacteraceae bacterium]
MSTSTSYAPAIGRWLLAAIFLISGIGKLMNPAGTIGYISAVGLPLPELGYVLAVIVEVGGGLLLVLGYQARIAALALAVLTIVAGIFFHGNFGDQNQFIHFLKNLAIAGGLLQVVAFGAGRLSFDLRRALAA